MAKELLKELIFYSKSEDYTEETLKYNKDMDVITNLTDMSSAILRWYPFKKGAIVLELNASYGAHTGALCDAAMQVISIVKTYEEAECLRRRYQNRDNLKVYVGVTAQVKERLYDYVISFGELETVGEGSKELASYFNYLKEISSYLKLDGKLLLDVENRFALRKLCGEVDEFSGLPFEGISGYLKQESHGRTFEKKEIEYLLKEVGLLYTKFYYPLYDSIIPKIIYTDQQLPENNVLERYISYYKNRDSIVMQENDLLLYLINNGVISNFSNEFLIEASGLNDLSDINYVTLSSQRTREKSFAVIMKDNNKVYKKPLYREGIAYAKNLCKDSVDLLNRGVPILPMHMEEDTICMDCIQGQTLQQYLMELAEQDGTKEEIIQIFDNLWQSILQSSDRSNYSAWDLEEVDIGPILKKAFIEMIPINCFWNDGEYLFFDQEFTKENCPASFVMMRAIRSVYDFIPKIQWIISKEELAKKYYINQNIWQFFYKKDNEFCREVNRPVEALASFRIGKNEIRENCIRLLSVNKESEKYHSFYGLLVIWKQVCPAQIELALRKFEIKKIGIYGCGRHGKLFFKDIKDTTIKMVAWFDQRDDYKEVEGIKVHRLNEIEKLDIDALIITPFREFQQIEKKIKNYDRYIKCIPLDQLIQLAFEEDGEGL